MISDFLETHEILLNHDIIEISFIFVSIPDDMYELEENYTYIYIHINKCEDIYI